MFISLMLNNLSVLVIMIGFWGLVVVKGNLLLVLMSVEILVFGFSVQLLVMAAKLDELTGQIFSLFLLTVAAAESAIGLALLVVYYKLRGNLKYIFFFNIKGLI